MTCNSIHRVHVAGSSFKDEGTIVFDSSSNHTYNGDSVDVVHLSLTLAYSLFLSSFAVAVRPIKNLMYIIDTVRSNMTVIELGEHFAAQMEVVKSASLGPKVCVCDLRHVQQIC